MRILPRNSARSAPSSSPPRERGAITVVSALVALLLVGIVGVALDTAWTLTARMQLQRTADAAALAAAAQLRVPGQTAYGLVRQAAVDTANSNGVVGCGTSGIQLEPNPGNAAGGDVVVGRWKFDTAANRFWFDPADPDPDAVQVRARCGTGSLNPALTLFFGPLFGQATSEGGRSAIARVGETD